MTTIKRFTPDYKMHAVRFEAFAREAEHGELVRFDAHQQVVSAVEAERDAQQKRADSLAVENAALKSSIDLIASAYTEGEPAGFEIDRARHIETPSTNAALAAIQAQGVEKFADDLHKTAMAMCSVKPDNTTPGAYAGMARSFAKKLREAK
ncbi:TPA: hypothetical protein ACWX6F_001262 [Serratia marcescens]|jgi:hypothetical protein|uniref:hypothetical protein n=1 Tax=Serratia marcescens TaxID=615 RepID=UPI000B6EEF84|nr:hypothetical protein [Serratia marcescens]OUI57952.1 hypothetical protein AZZ98_001793 [Serratia marcescens]